MNCPSCNKIIAPNLSICPSCGAIIYEYKIKLHDPYRLKGTLIAGKYHLEGYAGGGGMGAVYLALNEETKQKVAVKILKPDIAVKNKEYIRLFEQEIQAAQKISHPNIVKIFDSGSQDDLSFMVMEWLDGHTLEDEITKRKIPIEVIADIFRQVCSALIVAHARNVLHLDIKPANIFLLSEPKTALTVKMIDFGLARILSSETGTTATRFRGTDKYCSPEHYGGKLTSRSDVYSLGATLYHMLAGVVPFGTSYIYAKMYPNMQLPDIPSVLAQRPDFPKELDRVIQKALSKNPNERQESVKDLLDEFEQALLGKSIGFKNEIASRTDTQHDSNQLKFGEDEVDDLPSNFLRLNAELFDVVVCLCATLIILSPFVTLTDKLYTQEGLLIILINFAIILFIYRTLSIGIYHRTFGMSIFLLEIIDIEENDYLSLRQATVHSFIYLFSIILFGIGFLPMFFNSERRAAHDLLAGAIVVKE